jgi:hypothetical protein
VPDDGRDQIGQLTTGELDRYAHQLIRCLKALDTTAPIRDHVQHELITVRAEQGTRATAGDGSRRPDVTALAPGELERTRRELAASLALTRPGSPVRAPTLAHMAAIDAELAARAGARSGGSPRSPGARHHRDRQDRDY